MTINSEQMFTKVSNEVENFRKADYPINPLFLNRWSPRAYSNQKVSDQDLNTILEAAHWAPSSYNDQPWRFVVAKTDEQLKIFQECLTEFNQKWASKAPVLLLVASDKLRGNGDPNGAHSFDAGSAWGYLALQAKILGLNAHAMGGFDREKTRQLLNIPDHWELHCMVSIGYLGDKNQLDEALAQREVPSPRVPLEQVVFEGKANR